jgi:hypothetical protein
MECTINEDSINKKKQTRKIREFISILKKKQTDNQWNVSSKTYLQEKRKKSNCNLSID